MHAEGFIQIISRLQLHIGVASGPGGREGFRARKGGEREWKGGGSIEGKEGTRIIEPHLPLLSSTMRMSTMRHMFRKLVISS